MPPPGIWPSPGVPTHPIYTPPSETPPGGFPAPPVGGIPGPGGQLVWYWSPVYGWVAVPASGPISGPGDPDIPTAPEPPTPTPSA
jgi:hypothetical protein